LLLLLSELCCCCCTVAITANDNRCHQRRCRSRHDEMITTRNVNTRRQRETSTRSDTINNQIVMLVLLFSQSDHTNYNILLSLLFKIRASSLSSELLLSLICKIRPSLNTTTTITLHRSPSLLSSIPSHRRATYYYIVLFLSLSSQSQRLLMYVVQ